MVDRERLKERLRVETGAWNDQAIRVARNDPEWRRYFPGDPRPRFPCWRRLLKL